MTLSTVWLPFPDAVGFLQGEIVRVRSDEIWIHKNSTLTRQIKIKSKN